MAIAAATHHANGLAILCALAVMLLPAAIPGGVALRTRRLARRRLRRCPVCAAVAVRAEDCEALDAAHVCVHTECGQCGVWRRLETTPAALRRHSRALERDRRRIRGRARRLTRRRRRRDLRAFTLTLRSTIVGAEDFLAAGDRRVRR